MLSVTSANWPYLALGLGLLGSAYVISCGCVLAGAAVWSSRQLMTP